MSVLCPLASEKQAAWNRVDILGLHLQLNKHEFGLLLQCAALAHNTVGTLAREP